MMLVSVLPLGSPIALGAVGAFAPPEPPTSRRVVPTAARRVVRAVARSPVPDRAEVRAGPDA